MLQERTCRECQVIFRGGPRAYYCPDCRISRAKIASAEYKRRKRKGLTRTIGSTDVCERCRKPYTVEGGQQRFCPECQPIHAAEYDRITSLEFYKENKDKINPPRKMKRRKRTNICSFCGNVFEPVNGRTTCSSECKRQLGLEHHRKWREKENLKNAPMEEVFNMAKIARELGKHKSTIQLAYHSGKLPTPDGYSPSGRPFWFRSTVKHIIET